MTELDQALIREIEGAVSRALAEDLGDGDLTAALVTADTTSCSCAVKAASRSGVTMLAASSASFRTALSGES